MKVDIGVNDAGRRNLSQVLNKVLADTYTLYLKTQNFHWNVKGPNFQQLHLMFEGQYSALALAVDEIAERVRSLGYPALGTFTQFLALTSIQEPVGVPAATDMIKQLLADQEKITRSAHTVLVAATEAKDEVTTDLMIRRMAEHEKTAWMLRSLLEE
ncbi:MAG: DNA starvation/stationary phase protection protein [Proteobacteria bacterium]|nr:DNA starvation/stationary phase protection protein [Pseudomonadota bacterium]